MPACTVWERYVHFGRSAVAGAQHPERPRGRGLHPAPRHRARRPPPGRCPFRSPSNGGRTWGGWPSSTSGSRTGSRWWHNFPNEAIQGVAPGQRLDANLRNPKVFSDDRVEPASDADIEHAARANREEDADDPAERSKLTPALARDRADGLRFGSDLVGPCRGPHRPPAGRPPRSCLPWRCRHHRCLRSQWACGNTRRFRSSTTSVAVLLAAVGLGSTAVPGQNRGWVVERIGVTALVGVGGRPGCGDPRACVRDGAR